MGEESGYVQTSIEPINDLVGGLPEGSMTALFGPAEAGKTIFTTNCAYEVLSERGGNALIIDTEGSMHTYSDWHPRLSKRYEIDVDLSFIDTKRSDGTWEIEDTGDSDADHTLYILDCRSIQKLLALHGRGINIQISNKGKMSLRQDDDNWQFEIWDTEIGKWVDDHDISYLVYDSITNPLQEFGTERHNFPVRAEATNYLLLPAQLMVQEYNMVAFGVAHRSINPANPFGKPGVVGGKAIKHNHKFNLYLTERSQNDRRTPTPSDKTSHDAARYLWCARHPSRKPWVRSATLYLTSEGYVNPEVWKEDKEDE